MNMQEFGEFSQADLPEAWWENVCIIAAEASGDVNAALLMESIKKVADGPVRFWGIAGPKMRAQGIEEIGRVEDLSVMGLTEVLAQYGRVRSLHLEVEAEMRRRKPALLILVDAPAFNLRLAEIGFHLGCIVHYHIPPKVWAHGQRRVEVLRDHCHLVTCVLPFEEAYLREFGVRACYVGHPLKDAVGYFKKNHESFMSNPSVRATTQHIGLIPGSRKSEIRRHLQILVDAFEMVRTEVESRARALEAKAPVPELSEDKPSELPLLVGLIPIAETVDEAWFSKKLRQALAGKNIPADALRAVRGSMYGVLAKSDYAWVCSGTAVLEACFFEVPHSVCYRMSRLSYAIGRRIVQVKFIGLVNLIAGREVCPEFIQNQCSAPVLAEHAKQLLSSPSKLREMKHDLHVISESFPLAAADRAAQMLIETITYWTAVPRESRRRMHRRGLGPTLYDLR